MKIRTAYKFTQVYTSSSFNFGFCTKPVNGVVKSTSGPSFSCREYLCSQAATMVSASSSFKDTTFSTDKLRLLAYCKAVKNPSMAFVSADNKTVLARVEAHKKAIRLINSLEKNVGWPLTKSFRITENVNKSADSQLNGGDILFVVTGNIKWMRSPVLISMYTILLRSGSMAPVSSSKTVTADKDTFTKIVKSLNGDSGNYLKVALIYGIPLLSKFDAMFVKRSLRFNYSAKRLGAGSNSGLEGLSYLVKGNTTDKDLYARFKKHVLPLSYDRFSGK